MRPLGFIQALFGSCAGTEIFIVLRTHSWLRVIWHLVLLALLLSLLIAFGESRRIGPRLTAAEGRVVTEFGSSLLCAPDGIRPEKDPNRSRVFEAEPGVLLVYLGEKPQLELTAAQRALAHRMLLVAAPRCFAFAVFSDKEWIGRWQEPGAVGNFRCRDEELNYVLSQRIDAAKAPLEIQPMQLPLASIFPVVRGTLFAGFVMLWFGTLLMLAGLYTAVFAIVNRLVGGGRRGSPLTLGEYWKIGIYAGFPAMLVAAAFPIFDLPFLSYPTVYMIGLVIYWMIAAARVSADILAQTALQTPTTAEDDDDHEQ